MARPARERRFERLPGVTGDRNSPQERLAERLAYLRLGDDECRLLRRLRAPFDREADRIVERFYDHLLRFEPLRHLLHAPDMVKRLKEYQRAYVVSLSRGRFDETYLEDRLRIGRAHESIGLSPQWYIGSYTIYLEELIPLAREHLGGPSGEAAAVALGKVMNLDMQIVLDAYFEARQQKALERAERLAAVGELAASIAHEVRNPLAGMKGAMEVLRRDLEADPAKAEVVDELVAQIIRLENLVRDLLSYARPRPLDLQPVDLNALLDRVLTFAVAEHRSGQYRARTDLDAALPVVEVDPQQLEQVFLNLIQNSLQAMDGGTVTVRTRALNDTVEVIVDDEGPGIAPSDLVRVFQPFFTTRHRGSGLGLAIVQKILQAHGGSIRISSDPGRGTRATLTLPRKAGE
ncbi:MAG: protoglobin domain-containing protein [Acidobacteriota bacterium]